MRFLTFKNIIEYISNMNKDEKINLSDTFDIESRGYESFKSINLDSEISRTTLIKNNNSETSILNNDNCFEKINCLGFTFTLLFLGGIITIAAYFSNKK